VARAGPDLDDEPPGRRGGGVSAWRDRQSGREQRWSEPRRPQ
jgi:hypothetical protein